MSADWEDYGGAKPPAPRHVVVLAVLLVGLVSAFFGAPYVSELVGAYW